MDNQAFRFLHDKKTSNSYLPQNVHGLPLDKYEHLKFKKGEIIFLPEQISNKIYFILEGKIKMGIYLDTGREITQSILSKGKIFGELSIIGAEKNNQFASAYRDSIICAIPTEEVKLMMKHNSNLNFFLMEKIGSKLLKREQQLESLTFKNSRTRIIEFLIDLAQNNGIQVGYERLVNNFYLHSEIADMTATSRQSVTTILNELRRKKLLIFNRKRMLIRDMDNLSAELLVN